MLADIGVRCLSDTAPGVRECFLADWQAAGTIAGNL